MAWAELWMAARTDPTLAEKMIEVTGEFDAGAKAIYEEIFPPGPDLDLYWLAQDFAFVVRGDVVERRAVRVGGADGERLEVLAGLQPGDRVVVSPPPQLKDGGTVAVK